MKLKLILWTLLIFTIVAANISCAVFRYDVIPQTEKGPHGGGLVKVVDHLKPGYFELVVTQAEGQWTLQLYSYGKKMNPQTVDVTARAEIILPNKEGKVVDLMSAEPSFVFARHGIYHLEGKTELGKAESFNVNVVQGRSKSRHKADLKFSFSVSSK